MPNENPPMSYSVLIVEDEPVLARNMLVYLERHGLICQTASSGEEGLDALEASRPDAVVLDYNLPGKDGLSVLRLMREREPQLPGGDGHRSWQRRDCGGGHEGWRVRLSDQAGVAASAQAGARPRGAAAAPGAGIAAPAGRRWCFRSARGAGAGGAAGWVACHAQAACPAAAAGGRRDPAERRPCPRGVDWRRDRDGQGAGRARAAL